MRRTDLKKTFTPIADMVSLEVLKGINKTTGGIELPQTLSEQWESVICRVIATGPDVKWVKVGDSVLMANNTMAATIRHMGQESFLVPEKVLAGIVD